MTALKSTSTRAGQPTRPRRMRPKSTKWTPNSPKPLRVAAQVRRSPTRPRQADRSRTHRTARRRGLAVPRAHPSPPTAPIPGRRLDGHRDRGGRRGRVHARRQRPHCQRRHHQSVDPEENPACQPDRLREPVPLISLVESGGADLPTQKEIFIPGGGMFRDLTRLCRRDTHHRSGLRQLHRGRRVRARHVRSHRHDQGAVEGVSRRPALGEDGDR